MASPIAERFGSTTALKSHTKSYYKRIHYPQAFRGGFCRHSRGCFCGYMDGNLPVLKIGCICKAVFCKTSFCASDRRGICVTGKEPCENTAEFLVKLAIRRSCLTKTQSIRYLRGNGKIVPQFCRASLLRVYTCRAGTASAGFASQHS